MKDASLPYNDTFKKAILLQTTPLFGNLPAEALLPVARISYDVTLHPEEALFHQGEPSDAMYIITHGRIRVLRNQQVLTELGEGECVGELGAVDWAPRSATIIAITASTLLRLARDDLMDLLEEYPNLVRSLIKVLVQRLQECDYSGPPQKSR